MEWVQLRWGNLFSKNWESGKRILPAGDLVMSTSGSNPAIAPTAITIGSDEPAIAAVANPLIAKWLRVIIYLLFPIPYSLFPIPYSLFPIPYSPSLLNNSGIITIKGNPQKLVTTSITAPSIEPTASSSVKKVRQLRQNW